MIKKINKWLELGCMTVSGAAVVFMALVAFVDSIGRPFSHPLPGASEFVSSALMVFFFAGLPLVVKDDSHIRVGLMADFYGPRARKIEGRFTLVVETLAMLAFAWMIADQAGRLGRFGTTSVYFEMPVAPWVGVAFVFTVIAIWFAAQPYGAVKPADISDKVD